MTDLQQRVQPFGLLLLNLGDRGVRIGSPGCYLTFPDRQAAVQAVELLELVSPEKAVHLPATDLTPTGTTEITYPLPNSVLEELHKLAAGVGVSVGGDFQTGEVVVQAGREQFAFAAIDPLLQALRLANRVVMGNTPRNPGGA